jgi:hypothetical protein|uniref:DUF1858 domain-containing protein n=1 Tax=Desulfobacca acetoxidans TaxID=60893 RepID=A0A7V6A3U6_9BACT
MSDQQTPITPEMTILEVLSRYRQTEAVFRRYELETGVCLLCHDLFESLEDVAACHRLDLPRLLKELHLAAEITGPETHKK